MDHIRQTRVALDFIERNLRSDIRVGDVATAAHFSASHFHLIFAKVTGCTLAEYVRRRRLACAAYDLTLSRKRTLDIALEYRFDSQEAFTRAFKRLYGMTPGAFRRNQACMETMARMGVHRSKTVLLKGERSVNHQPVAAENGQTRLVLENVMRVGFYRGGDQCPEDIPFPSCLASVLRYLGEDYPWNSVQSHNMTWRLNMANSNLLVATGMAFGLLWREGWHPDNADLMFVADPRQVIARAFQSVGYDYELIQKTGEPGDESHFRNKIKESLRRGHPLLAFGIIGPPECAIITGYDEDGDVLIGWNYFQDSPEFSLGVSFEPSGTFRKRNWFPETMSMMVIGDKEKTIDPQYDHREVLRWALTIACTPTVYGRHSGLAAYEAWARQISDDAEFATDDRDILYQRHDVHNSAVGIVAECRWSAAIYLRQLAEMEPAMAEDLQAAADCYDQEHKLMWQAWGLVGGNGHPEAFVNFADPDIRRQMVAIIEKSGDLDAQAANHLEQALNRS